LHTARCTSNSTISSRDLALGSPSPVHVETLGDCLLLKRIEADLSQPELAVKSGVSVRKVKAWEHDQIIPSEAEWQALAGILHLDLAEPKT
jgi:ribosome-binding protein aMBF1 (putative translation factor)